METSKELPLPDYLEKLINKIAKEGNFMDYKITNTVGSNIGDGFIGTMHRATITGKQNNEANTLHLICKILPESDMRKAMSIGPFEQEINSYDRLMPDFAAFQQEKRILNGFTAYPKCYGTLAVKETQQYAVVLEDLRYSDYLMFSKFDKLDFEHASSVLKELGRFHAVSFAVRHQKPELFSEIKKLRSAGIKMVLTIESGKELVHNSLVKAISVLDPVTDAALVVKMNKLNERYEEILNECTDPEVAEPYCVVNHGDCWNNNMLYRYDDPLSNDSKKCVSDVRLIDWQMVQYCTPIVDLSHFLFLATEKPLRDKHFDDLLKVYHGSLSELLTEFGLEVNEIFSYNDMEEQLKRFAIYALVLAPFFLPMLVALPEDIPNLDDFKEGSKIEYGNNENSNKAFEVRMRDLIVDMQERGFFEL